MYLTLLQYNRLKFFFFLISSGEPVSIRVKYSVNEFNTNFKVFRLTHSPLQRIESNIFFTKKYQKSTMCVSNKSYDCTYS